MALTAVYWIFKNNHDGLNHNCEIIILERHHTQLCYGQEPAPVMVDEATKRTLAAITLLGTRAGPHDGDQWVTRLKEEYTSLIKVAMLLKV